MAATDMADIVAGLYTYISADSAFNTAVGGDASTAGRIRYARAQKGETYPYVVFHLISFVGNNTMATDGYSARFQFDIWESEEAGPRACMDVADALRSRLSRAVYAITNHEQTQMRMDNELPPVLEETAWRQVCDYVAQGLR